MTFYKTLWSGVTCWHIGNDTLVLYVLANAVLRRTHVWQFLAKIRLFHNGCLPCTWEGSERNARSSCFSGLHGLVGVFLEYGPGGLLVALPAADAHVTHSYHNDDFTASAR